MRRTGFLCKSLDSTPSDNPLDIISSDIGIVSSFSVVDDDVVVDVAVVVVSSFTDVVVLTSAVAVDELAADEPAVVAVVAEEATGAYGSSQSVSVKTSFLFTISSSGVLRSFITSPDNSQMI